MAIDVELIAIELLDDGWEDCFGDFDDALADWTKELEAAITDRWVEWRHERRERTNGTDVDPDRNVVAVVGGRRLGPAPAVVAQWVGAERVKEKRNA